jgi:hypothetical protein
MTDRVRKEQTFPASKWIFLLLIAFSALLTFQPAPASATAILTEELQLHIPWLSLENKVYAVDMTYSAGDNAFMLSGVAERSTEPPPGAAAQVNLSDLTIHIPLISFQGNLYSADLKYLPSGDRAKFAVVGAAPFVSPAGRGNVRSVSLLWTKSPQEITAEYFLFNFQATYGVSMYKMTYETIDPFGNLTEASGLMALPLNPVKPLPLLSYQHGTLVDRQDSISYPGASPYYTEVATILAASGYVVSAPDYLGLGDSAGLHPYVHAKSLATAIIDMVRGVRTYCAQNGIGLNGQLFLTGYSEGGYATMAAHREMETNYPDEFVVTASAPAAGSYDLSGATMQTFLSDEPYSQPYEVPYFLLAYDEIYGLADSYSDIFSAPYDSTIPPLFDGNHDEQEINAALPSIPKDIFSNGLLAGLESPDSNVYKAMLRENDVYRWTPRAPVRLYHCTADELVPYENSVTAYNYFVGSGATNVQLVPLPYGTHENCALYAHLLIKQWFDLLVR